MSNGRRRGRRVLGLAVLAILVFLLLEANRWLPGVWPGGGGDAGSRARDAGKAADPTRVVPPKDQGPPLGPSMQPYRIVVLPPPGKVVGRLTLASDAMLHPFEKGSVALLGSVTFDRGFSLTDEAGAVLRHGQTPSKADRDWTVQWPRAPLPALGRQAQRPFLVTGTDGKPVPGARIQMQSGDGDVLVTADAEGRSAIPPSSGPMRLCVSAEGYGEVCFYTRAEVPGEIRVRLPAMRRTATRFVDPDTKRPLKARSRSLVRRDGTVTTLATPEEGADRFEGSTPADQAAEESLEVEVAGRPPVRVPLASVGAETAVPSGRTITVSVRDGSGRPVARARVETSFAPPGDAETAGGTPIRSSTTTDAAGTATLALPKDLAAAVRVESDAFAPAGFRVEAGDADGARKDVRLDAGVPWSVRVAGPDGPLAGAEVVLVAKAGAETTRRTAKADAKGVATLAPVADGDVEVFAKAPGFAWASTRLSSSQRSAAPTIALEKGARLRVIVEDGYGLPVAGARVRAVARGGGGVGTETQGPDAAPWSTDANGVLEVADVPVREFDLYVTKAGYQDEVASGIVPGSTTLFATLVSKP